MARSDGFYWARCHPGQQMLIVLFKDGEYTFEGEDWESDESELMDLAGPLASPPIEDAGQWRINYDEEVALRLEEGSAPELAGGWDYLWGYYWVRTSPASGPKLFWYHPNHDGWGPVIGDDEFVIGVDEVDEGTLEILSGPLPPPAEQNA